MARLEYFIVCRSVSVDIDSDEITLSQVVEDIFAHDFQFPQYLPKIMAVSSWEMSPDELDREFQAILRITIPGQQDGPEFSMNLSRGRRRYRAMQGVLEIPLPGPGDLKFEVLLNGKHAATHVVTIHPPGVRPGEISNSVESGQVIAGTRGQ